MTTLKSLLFCAAVICTLGLLGFAFWLDTRPPTKEQPPQSYETTIGIPKRDTYQAPIDSPQPKTAKRTLRKCVGEQGEPVFTVSNDPNCEPYISGNTLSVIEQMPRNSWLEQKRRAKQAKAKNRRANTPRTYNPNIRLTGKSPPRGTSIECKFPIGRALEIERMLSAADDASESIWLEEYCEWVGEAGNLNCAEIAKTLHYEKLCFGKW